MTDVTLMLTENDIVEAVCALLESRGYRIERRLTSTQTGGVDIVASGSRGRILVEAKGATSSKPGTRRYGKGFNDSQRLDHVGKALMALLPHYGSTRTRIAMALPTNHNDLVEERRIALDALEIGVFLVDSARGVTFRGPWQP